MTWSLEGTRLTLVLAVAVLAVASVGGQSPPGAAAVDVTRLGPQVGEQVPGFTLPDQAGTSRSLETRYPASET